MITTFSSKENEAIDVSTDTLYSSEDIEIVEVGHELLSVVGFEGDKGSGELACGLIFQLFFDELF